MSLNSSNTLALTITVMERFFSFVDVHEEVRIYNREKKPDIVVFGEQHILFIVA